MRTSEITKTGNKTEERSGGLGACRISSVQKSDDALVDVGDYSASNITSSMNSISNQLQGGVDEIKEGSLQYLNITSINLKVNATPRENYRSELEKQLTTQFDSNITINLVLDESLPSTTASRGDIDYTYSETVTKEVEPVVITP